MGLIKFWDNDLKRKRDMVTCDLCGYVGGDPEAGMFHGLTRWGDEVESVCLFDARLHLCDECLRSIRAFVANPEDE